MHSATIARPMVLEGRGLISGERSRAEILPAPAGHGIVFKREDQRIPANPLNYIEQANCTVLASNEMSVAVVEHLLAAFWAAGIDTAEIVVSSAELPNIDGSAQPQYEVLRSAGLKQLGERPQLRITETLEKKANGAWLRVEPAEQVHAHYYFEHDELGTQVLDTSLERKWAAEQILPARSFITEKEAQIALAVGVLHNTNEQDGLVIRDGTPSQPLRFEDEYARHKVLDLIGDLYVLPFDVTARFSGYKSGHTLNRAVVRLLWQVWQQSS